jgi:hypothetical protein
VVLVDVVLVVLVDSLVVVVVDSLVVEEPLVVLVDEPLVVVVLVDGIAVVEAAVVVDAPCGEVGGATLEEGTGHAVVVAIDVAGTSVPRAGTAGARSSAAAMPATIDRRPASIKPMAPRRANPISPLRSSYPMVRLHHPRVTG